MLQHSNVPLGDCKKRHTSDIQNDDQTQHQGTKVHKNERCAAANKYF
jgi:hypothetical protein